MFPAARRLATASLGLLLSLLLPASALAQVPEPLPLPDIELEAGGAVFAVERLPDGRYVIGGRFSSVNGQPRSNLAMLTAGGDLVADWSPTANGDVRAIVNGGADTVFVGGQFTEVDGQPRLRLAKLTTVAAPGSRLDGTWNPGADGNVAALAYDTGGFLFVGGSFGNIGGGSRPRLAKLQATGAGLLVAAFQPEAVNGGPGLQALALDQAGGFIYAGGQVAGPGGRQFLRRYNTTSGARGTWNPNPDGRVSALLLLPDGDLIVGGEFTSIAGSSRTRLARITTATPATATGFVAGANGRPVAFAADTADPSPANHRLYVAGEFSLVGGQLRQRLARLNATTGTVDPGWAPQANGDVFDLVLSDGGSGLLIAAGPFSRIGGINARGIARLLDADGARDPAFAASAVQAGVVLAAQALADGSVYLGGVFDAVRQAGEPDFDDGYSNLLRLDPDGLLDAAWKPQVNGNIQALAADGDSLIIAGSFVSVDGFARDRIARFIEDGGELGLDPDWTPGTDGQVRALLVADGGLFVGGEFVNANDGGPDVPRVNLAKFAAATGALDTGFTPPAFDARVLALAVIDGSLYAGGDFTLAGSQGRNALARLSAASGGLLPWNPGALLGGVAGTVRVLKPVAGQWLLAGGAFDTLGGAARANLGRIHADTGSVTGYYAPSLNGRVDTLALDANEAAYIGGRFTEVNGEPRLRIARVGPTGDLDQLWAPTADGAVEALTLRNGSAPSLILAGFFLNISEIPRVGVAGLPTETGDTADFASIAVTDVSPSVTGQPFEVSVAVSNLDDAATFATGTVSVDDGMNSCEITLVPADQGLGSCVLPARPASASPLGIVAFFESDRGDLLNAISDTFTHAVGKADTRLEIVEIDPAAPAVGEPVTVRVAFAVEAPGAGVPSGLISVSIDGDACDIDFGQGEDGCVVIFGDTGERSILASYPGDHDFHGASDQAEVTVSGVPTTIEITGSAPAPSVTGETFTVAFEVTAANAAAPEGAVTVSSGSFSCGPVTLTAGDDGVGSCDITATAAGGLSLVATFTASGVFESSVAAPFAHEVGRAETALAPTSNGPTAAGATATVTANLSVLAPGAGSPGGVVGVAADTGETCAIDLDQGEGSCDLVLTAAGERTLTVSYAGDDDFLESNAQVLHQVDVGATTTSLDSSAPNPSAPSQEVSFGFSVSPATATGTVEVRRVGGDQDLVCSGSLSSGNGTCAAAFGVADLGTVPVFARYLGDDNFSGSDSDAFDHEVAKIATVLELSALASPDPDDIRVGDDISFSWTLTPDPDRGGFGTPTGTVTVVHGSESCSAAVSVGGCVIAGIQAFGEAVEFTASYGGDDVFLGSSDSVTLEILETPRTLSFDAAIGKRVTHSLVLLANGGDLVRYEVVVSNVGEDTISAANVLDMLPVEFDLGTVTWTCEGIDGGVCASGNGTGDIDEIVTLPSLGSVIFTIDGHIPVMPASGRVVNTALVEAGADDVDSTNNESSAGYQRCAPNLQSVAGDDEPRPHDCLFRNGFESPPAP